jgi:hypothetical protein
MRSYCWIVAVPLALGALACAKSPAEEETRASSVRQQIEDTIKGIEAAARSKAKALGMAEAHTADIDAARSYVCKALVAQLPQKKALAERDELAASLGAHACREREEWLAVLRHTAADQGLRAADRSSLNETRDFVCDRIKESLRAVRPADRAALETEGRVYDCIF